jgi:uncharacterized protein YheU (UPF0270 family)
MFIPYQSLRSDALRGIIEEFVSREGTEYGTQAYSLESKVETVLKQLESGNACLVFDPATETCDIVIKGSLRYKQVLASLASSVTE